MFLLRLTHYYLNQFEITVLTYFLIKGSWNVQAKSVSSKVYMSAFPKKIVKARSL